MWLKVARSGGALWSGAWSGAKGERACTTTIVLSCVLSNKQSVFLFVASNSLDHVIKSKALARHVVAVDVNHRRRLGLSLWLLARDDNGRALKTGEILSKE